MIFVPGHVFHIHVTAHFQKKRIRNLHCGDYMENEQPLRQLREPKCMAEQQLKSVLHHFQKLVAAQNQRGRSDQELLSCFIAERDEAAFAALVERHGGMVLGICRRLLRHAHDAEDACQAAFLVLARKAATIRKKQSLASWLHRVACHIAMNLKRTKVRRKRRELGRQAATVGDVPIEASRREVRLVLDEELARLPERYRAPLILCYLEGRTREEVARQLGCPEGTVAGRLARARDQLRAQLVRRGLSVSAGVLAGILTECTASAALPVSLSSSVVKAASLLAAGHGAIAGSISIKSITLAEGALKAMLLTKLKIATTVALTIAAVGSGGIFIAHQALAEHSPTIASRDRQSRESATGQPWKSLSPEVRTSTWKQKRVEELPSVVSGTVKTVDAANNSLTVVNQEGEFTFGIANDAHVDVDGKVAALAAIPPGANVVLSQFADRTTSRSIQAGGAAVFGSVKAVDVANRRITASGHPDDRTFRVSPETAVVIDGQPGALAGIPIGASLHALNLCVDQQTARSINIEGPSFHQLPVTAIDAEKETITVGEKAPPELVGKTIGLAANADIRVDGQNGKLADVPVGAFVSVVLSVDRRKIRRLQAEGPNLGGCGGSMVKAVDLENRYLVFGDRAAADVAGRTFRVAANANILIDGRPGRLGDVPPGAYLNLTLSVDRQSARQINAQGPRTFGVVKAVDTGNSSITVDENTFAVAKDALIVIDGRVAQLAALTPGSSVNLNLRVDQRTVGMIQTKAP